MQKYVASSIGIGVLLGTLYSFWAMVAPYTILLFTLLTVAYLCLAAIYSGGKNFIYQTLFCIALGVTLASARVMILKHETRFEFNNLYDKKVTLVGRVDKYPDKRSDYTYITLGDVSIDEKKYTEKILVKSPSYPEFKYGDILKVSGKLQRPYDSQNDGKIGHFSYAGYLSVDNIFSVINFPKIEKMSATETSIIGSLYSFKDKCIFIITYHISEPAAGLVIGILFGIKRALSENVLKDFMATGLVHIVVLSGYNIALVIAAASRLLKRTSPILKYSLIYISIIVFIAFVGASASVVRAGIMAAIALFARQYGREAQGLQLLSIASLAMILYQPRSLIYDPSFQLSFLATVGLIVWTPYIERIIKSVPKKFLLREIIASTVATQIVVIPYIIWYIGKTSTLGLLSNIIIVPLVPWLMLLGAMTLSLGLIWLPLATPLAILTYTLATIIIFITHTFTRIPGAMLEYSMPIYFLIIIYALQLAYLSFSRVTAKR